MFQKVFTQTLLKHNSTLNLDFSEFILMKDVNIGGFLFCFALQQGPGYGQIDQETVSH